MFFDSYYLILVVPAMLLALWAQMRVQSTFSRFQKVRSDSGYSGADVARRILDNNGLYDVRIEQVSGTLTDHYDPRDRVVRLSQSVYASTSVAAIGVAAHETGHAVQHAKAYVPLTMRNAIIPITNIGSQLSLPLILVGFLLSAPSLVQLGIVAFSLMCVFQLITLPVEFNASNRAMAVLEQDGILRGSELNDTRKVLSAAALTYVAALIVSIAQLLRLILLFGRRRND
ncbi:MAG: zinc metallopeptidase [Oscillospiraceae bacterium]